jgi:serine protease AprX
MKRIIIIAAVFMGLSIILNAQIAPDKYYVQFTDKNDSPFSINNPEEFLSQRAIDRRSTYNIAIDMKDIPVNPQYLQGVKNAGATIQNPTKWLNGVTVQTSDPNVITAIEALPYVESVMKSPVTIIGTEIDKPFFENELYDASAPTAGVLKESAFFDYGPSYSQISMLKGDQLHAMGYRGQGMIIAVLDAGYDNADDLAVFDSLWDNNQILHTRDFVDGGAITFNKHYHGTMVLSTMGGNYPGEIVGTAPEADYILVRTEDGGSEYVIEEYNWVSGAEYVDSLGADVINTSLGYSDFDDPTQSHTYEEMDGNTTIITIGADIAASRGMAVVNSAGNSGSSSWYYITAPADGDSVFTIGAVNWEGTPAGFSGNGPTYDGRDKPNVTAQGEGAYFADTGGGFTYGNGTSFSSPIMAGMVACLWQANPDMNNMELLSAIESSGSLASNPDNKMGFGIPDFMAAHNILTVIDGNEEELFTNVIQYPNPFTNSFEVSFDAESNGSSMLTIVDMTGRKVYENAYSLTKGKNVVKVNTLDNLPSGIYFMRMEGAAASITMKIVKQ